MNLQDQPRATGRRSALILCALAAFPGVDLASAQVGAAPEARGRIIITRQDLAELVQDVDALYSAGRRLPAAGDLSAEAMTNGAFDALSADFLGLRMGAAFEELETLRVGLRAEGKLVGTEFRLDVQVDDRWVRRAVFTGASASEGGAETLRLRTVRPLEMHRSATVGFEFWEHWEGAGGTRFEFRTDARGIMVPVTFRALVDPLRLHPTREPRIVFRSLIEWTGLEIRRVEGKRTPGQMRADMLARLAALEDVDPGAARAFTSRAELRWEAPSPERSSEFLTDGFAHALALEEELLALEAGEDPYRGRTGDHWRTHAHGRRDLPIRIFAPNVPGDAPLPLVVAFHGAGGDESFFFELAGNGRIKSLAERHGCVVVAPFTPHYLAAPNAFGSLLAALCADYPIDMTRIHVLGHSMGAMTTSRLVALRGDRIRAAACIAGFQPVPAGGPPVLVIQGERDPIIPRGAVKRSVAASEDADVTYVELEDMGHTLLLERALELAFEAWFPEPGEGR